MDLKQAKAIASVLAFPLTTDLPTTSARTNTSTFKDIESALEVPANNGDPAFYIINYKDDGFIMLSADNRLEPIRAFSYDEKFPFQSDSLSSGLVGWLAQTADMVYQT